MTTLRIGAVNYLNSKPLVHGLEKRAPRATLLYDLPSRLAESLHAGRLDVALIPSVEYLQNPDYQQVSDACVASRGPVRSVKLYFRTKPQDVRSLALDVGSRTSAALARILLADRYGLTPRLCSLPLGAGPETADADAVLVIGDRAMHPPGENYLAEWDLGQQWHDATRLPFVFACWAARPGVEIEPIAKLLGETRDDGLNHLEAIARREASSLGLSVDLAATYLRDHLHFTLGAQERDALQLFDDQRRRLQIDLSALRS